jgi:ribosome-associated toxin RatA of RatAB toxin-antitoxin module
MILVALAFVLAIDPPAPDVTVREERGVYSVSARFVVPQEPSIAHAVLTDYEQIPRVLPDVRTSIVRERTAGRVVVEQEAVAHALMFSKRVRLVLEITEEPGTIRFRDRCGGSFAQYEGSWHLVARNAGTEIEYALTARPSFDVPEFILKRLLKRDAGQMIARLAREMESRGQLTQRSAR